MPADAPMIECRAFLGGTRIIPRERLILRPSAYGLITHQGRALLVTNRNTGKLALPGGGVEVGERLVEGLQREIREETGIAVRVEHFAHFIEDFFYYDPLDEAFHGLLFFYHCLPLTFDLLPDDQVDDDEAACPRWFPIAALNPEAFQSFGRELLALFRAVD